ncbi:hypothetical protein JTE90_015122 [Oedothorax gibbosus]|uniref:C2H2-type domain-containing protein n=1 Tax=Oedothorax gibbosus TaxID=931172 RepID=A0AAV6VQ21_9ARAC|nr:hypothetical protein JTE90_015122 [Oedothorax gibbosus]
MREPVWLILSLHQKLRSAFQDSSYIISKSASGVTTYICPFCKFSTIDKTEMKNHMLTHTGPRQHSCDIWSLIKCLAYTSTTKPFVHHCSLCDYSSPFARDIKAHVLYHSGLCQHICKVCNKAFSSKGNLKIHGRVHTGERPFECRTCHRKFTQKISLMSHELTHKK